MKLRKIIAVLLVGACAGTMTIAVNAKEVDLKKELTAIIDGTDSVHLEKSGNPALEYADGEGIKVSGRNKDSDAIDFKIDKLSPGRSYTLKVTFVSDKATKFGIVQAESPWGLITASEENVKTATLEYTFKPSYDDGKVDGQNKFRLTTPGDITDYYIKSIDLEPPAYGDANEIIAIDDSNNKVKKTKSEGKRIVTKSELAKLVNTKLQHDTVVGKSVKVRVIISEPSKIKDDIYVTGYVDGDAVTKVKARFDKKFTNTAAVIHFDQTGSWGQTVRIAAKVNLGAADINNLAFYGFDAKTNKCLKIKNPNYKIDKNGYLWFNTEFAGDIIISDKSLNKK